MTNSYCVLTLDGSADCLWSYGLPGRTDTLRVAPPVFELDGRAVPAVLSGLAPAAAPRQLANGAAEHRYTGAVRGWPGLRLDLVFRLAPDSPVVRFRYILWVDGSARWTLTKHDGRDQLTYLGLDLASLPLCTEVRISEFDASTHAFRPHEVELADKEFDNRLSAMGPILTASDGRHSLLVAYEHGSQFPDAFLQYRLEPGRQVALQAVKGNYWSGQPLDATHALETVWFQLAAVDGPVATLASRYRSFVWTRYSASQASRRPWIFYNTWAFQERNKWWNRRTYLESMNQERMLAEIDVAHRMGIDVFVLDTGWYEKTGDWRVSRARFPDGLEAVRAKLAGYGMKLGLWFSPTEAAVTSRILGAHRDALLTWEGKPSAPHAVWETEESQCLCLASRYWEAFADELIRLSRELGVTYFKWDAVGQYGCDAAGHAHGDAGVARAERAEVYAFEQVRYMVRIVERLCAACPDAIVDFDITEGGRSVGLAFLSAGKYFLINNGPYFPNYDLPYDWATAGTWSNIFVHPGPARGWICRAPLDFDRWIPSVLFLTHYLPDAPAASQLLNIASLVLGQNGIWGDLLAIPEEGIARFGRLLGLYKQVRDDLTAADPVRSGQPGGSPEIHEKLEPLGGRGAVAVFATTPGRYTYVTRHRVAPTEWASDGVTVTRDPLGRARLEIVFDAPGAQLVFFGVSVATTGPDPAMRPDPQVIGCPPA